MVWQLCFHAGNCVVNQMGAHPASYILMGPQSWSYHHYCGRIRMLLLSLTFLQLIVAHTVGLDWAEEEDFVTLGSVVVWCRLPWDPMQYVLDGCRSKRSWFVTGTALGWWVGNHILFPVHPPCVKDEGSARRTWSCAAPPPLLCMNGIHSFLSLLTVTSGWKWNVPFFSLHTCLCMTERSEYWSAALKHCLVSLFWHRREYCWAIKRWACPYEGTLLILPLWEFEILVPSTHREALVWWATVVSSCVEVFDDIALSPGWLKLVLMYIKHPFPLNSPKEANRKYDLHSKILYCEEQTGKTSNNCCNIVGETGSLASFFLLPPPCPSFQSLSYPKMPTWVSETPCSSGKGNGCKSIAHSTMC